MLGAGGVVAGATAVAGCASGAGAASSNTVAGHSAGAAAGAPATRPSGPATLMVVRHAEKPPDSGNPRDIDADGDNDKHSLVVTGWARAGAPGGAVRFDAQPAGRRAAQTGRAVRLARRGQQEPTPDADTPAAGGPTRLAGDSPNPIL